MAASGAAVLLPLAVGAFGLTAGSEPPTTAPEAGLRTATLADGVSPRPRTPPGGAGRGVAILQIGDSHTAADLFTGTVRQILQERFGAGGVGYLPAGLPHAGVRSTRLKLAASPGWTYESLQRSAHPEAFGLSGFNATAARAGEVLTFASETPVAYGAIEIEARTGPDAGAVTVEADGVPVLQASLAAGAPGARILRVPGGGGAFRTLTIRTAGAKPVTLQAVGIFRAGPGITYSSLGFPGATVDLIARLPPDALAEGLRRLAPDIVVLAFGTNEGFDARLDGAGYRARYAAVLRTIRRALPEARLVMIGPPQAERAPPACTPAEGRPCPAPDPAETGDSCPRRPPQLDRVRAVQRRLAEAERIPFWDWWAIMPGGCGASRWATHDPPLMARDRVHFTRAGYRAGGQAFAAFLEPEVRALLRGADAVSHH